MNNFFDITITDVLMVIITAVYVIATIKICKANTEDVETARELIKEQQKQFDESNRAIVNVIFETQNANMAVLNIHNSGNRVAKNVRIKFDEEFINNIPDEYYKVHLKLLVKSSFSIGIGQSWYCTLGSFSNVEEISKEKITGKILYADDFNDDHNESFEIDLTQYFWATMSKPKIDEVYKAVTEQSVATKRIEKSISSIAKRLNGETGDEENE